jgi:hypothetical protein
MDVIETGRGENETDGEQIIGREGETATFL